MIKRVAECIEADERELIYGSKIVEIIKTTPLAESNIPEPVISLEEIYESTNDPAEQELVENKGKCGFCSFIDAIDAAVSSDPSTPSAQVHFIFVQPTMFERPIFIIEKDFEISEETARLAAEVIIGNVDVFKLLTPEVAKAKFRQVLPQ